MESLLFPTDLISEAVARGRFQKWVWIQGKAITHWNKILVDIKSYMFLFFSPSLLTNRNFTCASFLAHLKIEKAGFSHSPTTGALQTLKDFSLLLIALCVFEKSVLIFCISTFAVKYEKAWGAVGCYFPDNIAYLYLTTIHEISLMD